MKNEPKRPKTLRVLCLALPIFVLLFAQALTYAKSNIPEGQSCADIFQNISLRDSSESSGKPGEFVQIKLNAKKLVPLRKEDDESPLSKDDMEKVMKWIAGELSVVRLPFCWKQSKPRGVGSPLSSGCSDGTEKNGLLCYPKCKQGYAGVGPVCYGTCPSGFKEMGVFCQKPATQAAYDRAGYPWEFGDALNLNAALSRCEANYGAGNCEKTGEIIYAKCRAGFKRSGIVGCVPIPADCPSGYQDSGIGCTKPSYGRGAGKTLGCPSGTVKDGVLCYPKCDENYTGVGPVCWSSCPSNLPTECAAGCAKNIGICINNTRDQVTSTIAAAISLASMGSGSGSTVGNVAKMFERVTDAIELQAGENGGNIEAIKDLLDIATSEFSDNFAEITSDEINDQIDEHFNEEAAVQIKKEWAINHYRLGWKPNITAAVKNILTLVTNIDPTGLVGVTNAFAHPICGNDNPFPKVKPLY